MGGPNNMFHLKITFEQIQAIPVAFSFIFSVSEIYGVS